MARARSGVGRYFVVITGLVLTLAGVAALALFLSAAGAGAGMRAVALGVAAVIGLGGGIALLTMSARRRGGMLDDEPTTGERVTYWEQHRHRSWHGRHV
jgi:hypothetical protein